MLILECALLATVTPFIGAAETNYITPSLLMMSALSVLFFIASLS
jgi:hypothetical protein